ncbi:protein phosphatase methylesterase 1 isoform X2 [Hydra vulgaris]|uniref:Protein phosphatase methylesterase 1 n=1 Tax=Hydra vulgaris TaxID=6087 RepID=A0ABM4CZT1_HYDVU
MSSLQREVLKKMLPPLPNPLSIDRSSAQKSRFSGLVPKRKTKEYSELSWKEFFDENRIVNIGENNFSVYLCGYTGPLLVLLHGGGHSALSWALFARHVCSICECRIMAIDLRGHGSTFTTDDLNLAAEVLAQDVANVVMEFYEELPPIILLGHSMGGAIAVHVAVKELIPLVGLAVIDVVEGTALDALSSMQSFLRSRPQTFKSTDQAIEWSLRSGTLRNIESARVSVPGQIRRRNALKVKALKDSSLYNQTITELGEDVQCDDLQEEKETHVYEWRIDLKKTEQYWKGWFENMSSLFLSCSVPKMLILAGIDRLDTALTIGQMQGKFQMQVLAKCGHMVHEDVPDKVAEIIAGFLIRQNLTMMKEFFPRHMPEC